METVYFNGEFIPKEQVCISPDDRGFLFADGIYEVVRWYGKAFFDMEGHLRRLKRSLGEVGINWIEADHFPFIAERLVLENSLADKPAMVYLQVTRGAAKRTHYFPQTGLNPTSYSYAFQFNPDEDAFKNGIKAILRPDIRWKRCDIKSIALLPNTMLFNEAYTKGFKECIFSRDGFITEGAHSNIFFVKDDTLLTHPESNNILSGISRNNVIKFAREKGIRIIEKPVPESDLVYLTEAFITNTSSEVAPVTELGGKIIGKGIPGPVTRILQEKFRKETALLKA